MVLWTPTSANRPWVLLELGLALGQKPPLRIVAVRYGLENDTIPAMLKSKKGFHLNDLDQYLSEVVARVQEQPR